MKKSDGITVVALIVTIIVILILVGATAGVSKKLIEKSKKNDIVTTMLLIKSKTKIIKEKKDFGDIEQLTGIALTDNNGQYVIAQELQSKLSTIENSEIYILTQDNLNEMNIQIDVDTEDFYLVDYNNNEIYYSLGYSEDNVNYYSLTELDMEE